MASIIAGHGHGKGGKEGVLGVAPEVKILPVRVLLEDSRPEAREGPQASGTALAKGIRWAADQGADVINLSLGDDSDSAHPEAREDAAVRYALSKGSVVVASAGNGGERGRPRLLSGGLPRRDRRDRRRPPRRACRLLHPPLVRHRRARPARRCSSPTRTGATTRAGAPVPRRPSPPAPSRSYGPRTRTSAPPRSRNCSPTPPATPPRADAATLWARASSTRRPPSRWARTSSRASSEPSQLPYRSEYFGAGPEGGPSAGWLATITAALGVLLIGSAVAVHLGVDLETLRGLRRRLTSR